MFDEWTVPLKKQKAPYSNTTNNYVYNTVIKLKYKLNFRIFLVQTNNKFSAVSE